MFATIGATVFFGAACSALFVMVEMVRGYWPLIVAALNGEAMPRTMASAPHVAYRPRSVTPVLASAAISNFTPQRLAPHRVRERVAA